MLSQGFIIARFFSPETLTSQIVPIILIAVFPKTACIPAKKPPATYNTRVWLSRAAPGPPNPFRNPRTPPRGWTMLTTQISLLKTTGNQCGRTAPAGPWGTEGWIKGSNVHCWSQAHISPAVEVTSGSVRKILRTKLLYILKYKSSSKMFESPDMDLWFRMGWKWYLEELCYTTLSVEYIRKRSSMEGRSLERNRRWLLVLGLDASDALVVAVMELLYMLRLKIGLIRL